MQFRLDRKGMGAVTLLRADVGKSSTAIVSHHSKDAKLVYGRALELGATFVDRHGLLSQHRNKRIRHSAPH